MAKNKICIRGIVKGGHATTGRSRMITYKGGCD